MKIYRYITYQDKNKTKLFDLTYSLKVDEEDISLILELVNSYLATLKKVTLSILFQDVCQHTNLFNYEINDLELRSNLKPYIYLLYADNLTHLECPPYYCKKLIEAERYKELKEDRNSLANLSIRFLYRNPFIKPVAKKRMTQEFARV